LENIGSVVRAQQRNKTENNNKSSTSHAKAKAGNRALFSLTEAAESDPDPE